MREALREFLAPENIAATLANLSGIPCLPPPEPELQNADDEGDDELWEWEFKKLSKRVKAWEEFRVYTSVERAPSARPGAKPMTTLTTLTTPANLRRVALLVVVCVVPGGSLVGIALAARARYRAKLMAA